MSVLCPQDQPDGNRDDRIGSERITSESASEYLRELWDDAATCDPAAWERAAALEADTRLAAVQCEVSAMGDTPWRVRKALLAEADALLHLADEMQSATMFL